jgi:SAM-dependent methyltransferase
MTVFDGYAVYYDLLYRDKNYEAESRHVHEVIQRHHPAASTLLEMGCGTGRHAAELSRIGYTVHGIDRSRRMLDLAIGRLGTLPAEVASRLTFSMGDVRQTQLAGRFDAVTALFHVFSYLPETTDLRAAMESASRHLNPGGILLFDCWYGPAVLSERPSVRVKRMSDDEVDVVRIAEPTLHVDQNRVDVHYEISIRQRKTGRSEILRETHRMRYFFRPELNDVLGGCGMRMIDAFEWMTGAPPGRATWGVCFVATT